MKKVVVVTGGFDPIHSGHIDIFKAAKQLGDVLVVGLNSDEWLTRKKGAPFMPWAERATIVENLSMVDKVIAFGDYDGTAIEAILKVKVMYPDHQVVFANGGDRNAGNVPEVVVPEVLFKFGVGGENKANSSSWILQEWKAPKTERPWGYYRVIHNVKGTKVKELTINPGQGISLQRHNHRSEFWHIIEGKCTAQSFINEGYAMPAKVLEKHDQYFVPKGEIHQIKNPFEEPCKIVEIQYGELCSEDDIERLN